MSAAATIYEDDEARAAKIRAAYGDPREHGAECDSCPIRDQLHFVPPQTSKKIRLVIVSENPGRYESFKAMPLIGPPGMLLDRTLMENNIERRHVHVTSTILCRPESEDQISGAVAACSRRLFRELKAIDAAAPIVALGKESAKAILGTKGIVKSRGFVWQTPPKLTKKERLALKRARAKARQKEKFATVYNLTLKIDRSLIAGRTVFPTLPPTFILRSEIWAPVFDVDMARVAKYLDAGNKLALEDERPFVVVSSTKRLRKLLRPFHHKDVLVDIETDGPDPLAAKMLCCGFATPKLTIVAYPWRTKMAGVAQQLFDGGAKLVGHNVITFDCLVLERYGISVGILDKASECDRVEDTLVAHHSFASHLPKSLAHVVSVFGDSKPWKIIAKGGDGKSEKGQLPHQLSPDELTKYNAQDCMLNVLAWHRMQPDLESERRVYEISKRLGGLCARMRWKGFAFDMAFAKDLSRQLQARKQNLLWEMRDLIGDDEFKPSRAFDLRQVLFTRLKVPLIYPTKSGLPATSRVVLEQLRHGQDLAGKLCDLILRWRDAQKTLGTYLNVEVRPDGRVHDNWRIGSVTGRLAGRLLTLPRFVKDKKTGVVDITDQVRSCYISPPGRVLVYFDLAQAEPRYAANLSGDPVFIEVCKGDVHTNNAKILFPQEEKDGFFVGDEAKKGRGAPFRDMAKSFGLAITYGAEAETLYVRLNSQGFPVSLQEVRASLDRLRTAYVVYFKYCAEDLAFVQKHGFLRTAASGRIRYFGHTPKPTETANYKIQAGIADLMNERLLSLEALLPQNAFIVAQIHDAAIIEADEGDADVVKQIIADVYGPPVCLPDRAPFEIPAETKIATRWSEL